MYSTLPPKYRHRVQWALVACWLTLVGAGYSAIIDPPATVLFELGGILNAFWGALLGTAATVAAVGVATSHYRWEWIAAWLATAGAAPYAVTVWWLIFAESALDPTHGFVASLALMMCIKRVQSCSAHAAKLRDMHEEVSRVAGP